MGKIGIINYKELDISPFSWINHNTTVSVCLYINNYKRNFFDLYTDADGNGYDWESLAHTFIKEKFPNLIKHIKFDSEANMFCAYSENSDALHKFIIEFKKICENSNELKYWLSITNFE